ncbi:cysteine desulfurase family protein [Sphingomonas aracearum]|uniref:Cysteine desulfurase n=1 Tax=Sphingomonas aracearum TaxID=2283317 RepID=A0A369VVS0_9SPHN|nr:aminotransferase class V-fold PLP-dependent enzyme [Sphingomonas aracearum]RDE06438.1 aminotransferase class V-fold PLP-dependent enzyme [Sphingomonas aracearum]
MTARLYLDHAATSPLLPEARAAMLEGMQAWANPSSPHAEGRQARAMLERARASVGSAYGWTGEVLFTSGASESLALALGRTTLPRRLITAVEHDAVFRAAGEGAGVVPVGSDGLVDMAALEAMLAAGPALVCVQWANSETGVRQPIATVAECVRASGGRLLLDAAQMPAGRDAEAIAAADLVALSAHKRGGPPGIGALLVRDLSLLHPSGGQERGYRAGTENLPAVLGYGAALAVPEPSHATLRARLDDAIRRSGGQVVADAAPRHAAIGSYRLPGKAASAALIRFDLAGIAVSAGSACSSGSLKPSHVLGAMGWTVEASREVIRVSFGRSTTADEVDRFVAAWRDILGAARLFAA